MEHMIKLLTKQAQLLEIELANYAMFKKNNTPAVHPESYYANLAHAYKGIKFAIKSLEQSSREEMYVH